MKTTPDRVCRAFTGTLAVEHYAPGMVRVWTWSGLHVVDVRHRVCDCRDFEYNLDGRGCCKHIIAALVATNEAAFADNLALDVGTHELVDDINDRHADR